MDSADALEFNKIIEKLQQHALTQKAREILAGLQPCLEETLCQRKMRETTEARRILDSCGSPPLPTMKGLEEILTLCEAGAMLVPEQLAAVMEFAAAGKRMTAFLKRAMAASESIGSYGGSLCDLSGLQGEIDRCIRGEEVVDDATPALRDIRRKKEKLEAQIKEKLNHILQSRKQYLSDSYIATRGGRYVLPVKKECKNQFGGNVVEISGKGGTLFMEPTAVAKLQDERSYLDIQEDGEVRRILYTLTAQVSDELGSIRRNIEAVEVLDVLFAKAKLSEEMKARPVEIGGERRIVIREGRHPLLDREHCVPLDFAVGDGVSGIIITGPNTGGKTVAVKTVGLLSMMAQSGLHIPCEEGSYIAMQDGYWCDIGDGQSISQNLSTFSGHMTNVISILEQASPDSLVLLDELGSGTDPAEGMGIAIAVLEELRERGCIFLVTTHYPQVKTYAETAQGINSARMAFDRESLRPLYRLEMGKTGESCALYIAMRLGLPQRLLDRAEREAYGAGQPVAEEKLSKATVPRSRLRRAAPPKPQQASHRFGIGDSVIVLPGEEIGIVYRPADEMGEMVVQVKGEKRRVNHTRLRLKVSAQELYPPDYDFSILFDPVEIRKARKKMGKRHDPNLTVEYEEQ